MKEINLLKFWEINLTISGRLENFLESDLDNSSENTFQIVSDNNQKVLVNVHTIRKVKEGVYKGYLSIPGQTSMEIFISIKEGAATFDAKRLDAPAPP